MRDYETLVAVKAKWDAVPAIIAAVPGGLLEPPVPERDDAETRRPKLPFATATCGPDSKPNDISYGAEIDYRRLRLVVYGDSKATVKAAGLLVDAAFAEQALDIANADWMRTEPDPAMRGGRLERGEKTNEGETWRAIFEYRVWTSRPKSA